LAELLKHIEFSGISGVLKNITRIEELSAISGTSKISRSF
jgi:hypothetical protein